MSLEGFHPEEECDAATGKKNDSRRVTVRTVGRSIGALSTTMSLTSERDEKSMDCFFEDSAASDTSAATTDGAWVEIRKSGSCFRPVSFPAPKIQPI
ncbi:hypothetical protein MTP99_011391 [Tenebrio molitor]|jgi:hypothetical protein|nr:hypothetical protein MTP99_011391 [Tenebrio molitor]